MTREEEILNAIVVIRKALVDRMVYGPDTWDRKKNLLKEIVIRFTGVHTVSYDSDGGRDLGNGYYATATKISDYATTINIEDPTVAIKAERDAAQAALIEAQKRLETLALEKANAQKRLDDLNNKLIGNT